MSDDARAPRESLPALTTLRFVAAMAVVLFHADYLDPVLPVMVRRVAHASYVAVTLFYVLSGFILTWNHGEAFAAGRLRASDFWLARFARVYPAYLVAAGLWWLVARSQEPPVHAMSLHTLVSLAGLQPWSPSTIPGTNIPGWSVGVEACFYLAFPLLASRLVGASSRLRAGTILVASYALSLLSWLAFRAHGNGDEAHLLTGPLFRLPEFVAGMCLGRLFVLE
ncbi:MAG: acyltransferase, partial [Deltaproteobacteria bacterium]